MLKLKLCVWHELLLLRRKDNEPRAVPRIFVHGHNLGLKNWASSIGGVEEDDKFLDELEDVELVHV
jgi:hypothetical protein